MNSRKWDGLEEKRGLGENAKRREVTGIAERRKDPEQREKEPNVGSTKPRERRRNDQTGTLVFLF